MVVVSSESTSSGSSVIGVVVGRVEVLVHSVDEDSVEVDSVVEVVSSVDSENIIIFLNIFIKVI